MTNEILQIMDARGKNMIDTEIVNKFKKAKEASLPNDIIRN